MNVAIEAVIDLDTCAAIDEVNEPDFVEVLTECDDPDVEDVAGDVVFPSNSSLPPCMHLETAECIEERPNLEVVIIPAELETEEVDVPTDEPFGLDDSSAGHHVLVCREEPVDTVFEKLWKSSKAVNALGDHISLDAGRADELEAGGDVIQVRIPDSGGVLWSAVCVSMIAAVIVGMENNVDPVIVEPFGYECSHGPYSCRCLLMTVVVVKMSWALILSWRTNRIPSRLLSWGWKKELNDEKKDAEQHTLKDPTTDAPVITERARSRPVLRSSSTIQVVHLLKTFRLHHLMMKVTESIWGNRDMVSVDEKFTFDKERDLPRLDSIVDESRGQ